MIILFILNELPFPKHRNGVAQINYEILVRAPYNITIDIIVADVINLDLEASLRQLAPQIRDITYLGLASDRRYRVGNLITGALFGRNFFELPEISQRLSNASSKYDVTYVAPLMSFFDFYRTSPVFLNAVDSFAVFNKNAYKNSGKFINYIKHKLYDKYESNILKSVALTSFVSDSDLNYVRERNPHLLLRNIPLGVDTDYFYFDSTSRESHSLLFTGNFSYSPNAEAALYLAIEIFPLIRAVRPTSVLYIIGRNPPIELVGLPGVITTGFVEDIREYFWRCTVYVCPLRTGSGVKYKILEAMASGIPIISSTLGIDGIEGMQCDVNYLHADNVNDFVRQSLMLFDSIEIRTQISKCARDLVTTRTGWKEIVVQYYEAMSSLRNAKFRF